MFCLNGVVTANDPMIEKPPRPTLQPSVKVPVRRKLAFFFKFVLLRIANQNLECLNWYFKLARLDFLGATPLKFEHKLSRH